MHLTHFTRSRGLFSLCEDPTQRKGVKAAGIRYLSFRSALNLGVATMIFEIVYQQITFVYPTFTCSAG